MSEHIFDTLHQAIASACHRDLPEIKYKTRDWSEYKAQLKKGKRPPLNDPEVMVDAFRRPEMRDIEIVMFSQGWGSTALGYGGMGGASMTSAYTVLVQMNHFICVYFGAGGRLAYGIDLNQLTPAGREAWHRDVADQNIASVADKGRYTDV